MEAVEDWKSGGSVMEAVEKWRSGRVEEWNGGSGVWKEEWRSGGVDEWNGGSGRV